MAQRSVACPLERDRRTHVDIFAGVSGKVRGWLVSGWLQGAYIPELRLASHGSYSNELLDYTRPCSKTRDAIVLSRATRHAREHSGAQMERPMDPGACDFAVVRHHFRSSSARSLIYLKALKS